jgi:hypothetical protein
MYPSEDEVQAARLAAYGYLVWAMAPVLFFYDPFYGKVKWLDRMVDWMED